MVIRARMGVWAVLAAVVALLAGCGQSPPAKMAAEEIGKELLDGREGVEMVGLKVAKWGPGRQEKTYKTTWTAKLRMKEPHGYVVARVNGTHVVRVVLKAGEELAFSGSAMAEKANDGWHCAALVDSGDDNGWANLERQVGEITMGYPVIGGAARNAAMRETRFIRGGAFFPLSHFKPAVEEGSEEMKKLIAAAEEQQQREQEAAMERARRQREEAEARRAAQQKEYEERQRKAQEEAAERQRLAQEQAEAQRKQREEEARQRAEAARVARLAPMVKPFKEGRGVVVAQDAGLEMGAFVQEAEVDEEAFTVKGRGVDLREMPFKPFTFEARAEDRNNRGALTLTMSHAAEPVVFTAANALGLSAGGGVSLVMLSESERTRLDGIAALGKRLEVPGAELATESLDEAGAKTRLMDLQGSGALTGLTGTIIFRGRNGPQIAPLFTPENTRQYAWKAEPLVLRLKEPARGKGLLIKAYAATDNLLVVVNGVHRAKVASIPKLGAAVVALPSDLDVLEIRLEAVGSASSRGVVLVK